MFWTLTSAGNSLDIVEPSFCRSHDQFVRLDDLASALRYLERFSSNIQNTAVMQKAAAIIAPGSATLHGAPLLEQLAQLLLSGKLRLRKQKPNPHDNDMMFACGIPRGVWHPVKQQADSQPDEDPEPVSILKPRKLFVRIPGTGNGRGPKDCRFSLKPSNQCASSPEIKTLYKAGRVRDNLMELGYPGLDPISNYDLGAKHGQQVTYRIFKNVA